MRYFAHSTDSSDKSTWQLLHTHLTEVERLSGELASAFDAQQWAQIAGRLHDLGKYSIAFQNRLDGSSKPVDHATAGALALVERWSSNRSEKVAALILAYIIAGHHAGLPDYGTSEADGNATLRRRLSNTDHIENYQAAYNEIQIPAVPTSFPLKSGPTSDTHGLQFSFFIRMLFSCLVDADSLNTESFDNPDQHLLRKREEIHHKRNEELFKKLQDRFYLYRTQNFHTPRGNIDRWRTEIFDEVMLRAGDPRGMFSLTLPTGSGKTQVSLGFALEHVVTHQMRRIIYVIPYTSIIEQNAQEFRNILGDKHVLEHHSNFQHQTHESKSEAYETTERQKLAEENWELPIVVTTNVQFFESLFAARRSPARKLHNIAGSVIVLDEAQMMNGGFFRPCLYALEELVRNYGCSVVFCTATQPPISKLLLHSTIQETVQNPQYRYDQFERVNVRFAGILDWESLTDQIEDSGSQALCIVNTRGNARLLYETLAERYDENQLYHLSARMCPKHRKDILKIVKSRLEEGLPCVLVSTQLIEAGVDIDFPTVYRELAGIDSIAQAAGRCNRNGRLMRDGEAILGVVTVFETEKGLPDGWMSLSGSVARKLLVKFEERGQSPLSIEAVHEYFEDLFFYSQHENHDPTDTKGILKMIEENAKEMQFPFKTVAKEFQLIDSQMQTVLIPYVDEEEGREALEKGEDPDAPYYRGHAAQLLDKLKTEVLSTRTIMRALQPYTVQLYPHEFNEYQRNGELNQIREGVFALARPYAWYDLKTGVKPYSQDSAGKELLLI
ncbi:CRISPR-associated helicase Cas3' [Saccharibacillus sp. JS10]|uniref:CRISPR-associated helicase Cas3' n=1 Tax=Saccharibacillus sp. JS10 TaxID=2950552 RepID=UPI00210A4EE5|nr:CRISPR-associated helicase Cas3' [Saccharibacillus sp. JS10]MCQ4085964.1 CRISPR-associated helicase Cas3' [Saccharibacillus sp. JS10]